MKLLRYGAAGHEQPGILDSEGSIRSLSNHIPDLSPAQLSPDALKNSPPSIRAACLASAARRDWACR